MFHLEFLNKLKPFIIYKGRGGGETLFLKYVKFAFRCRPALMLTPAGSEDANSLTTREESCSTLKTPKISSGTSFVRQNLVYQILSHVLLQVSKSWTFSQA